VRKNFFQLFEVLMNYYSRKRFEQKKIFFFEKNKFY
jgi:hypothetical protein